MKEENRHHESSGLLFKNSSTTHSLLTKAEDLRHLILNVTDGADNFFTLWGICYGRRVMHTSWVWLPSSTNIWLHAICDKLACYAMQTQSLTIWHTFAQKTRSHVIHHETEHECIQQLHRCLEMNTPVAGILHTLVSAKYIKIVETY